MPDMIMTDWLPVKACRLDIESLQYMLKYVDYRLLDNIPEVSTRILFRYNREIVIFYEHNNRSFSVIVTGKYIIVKTAKESTMLSADDGDIVPIRERLFGIVMSLLNEMTSDK